MKKTIVVLCFMQILFSAYAQSHNSSAIWVVIRDSSAFPVSSTQSDNVNLNNLFTSYGVTDYGFDFEYYYGVTYDSVLEVYKIEFDSVSIQWGNKLFKERLQATGLFLHVFDFAPSIRIMVLDSTALPASPTTSGNEEVNRILQDFNVRKYALAFPGAVSDSLRNYVVIAIEGDIIDLYRRLLPLWGTVFSEYWIDEYVYTDPPLRIAAPEANGKIHVYPNPVGDKLYFSHIEQTRTVPLWVEIFSMDGRRIMSKNIHGSNFLTVQSLKKGSYIVKITNNNRVSTLKIIKQ